ncbi:N-6 DNA methylase [Vibrio sp. 665]|nr:N-6 DNA methylase [Vibrio sp. 665]MDW2032972.1 N-6 DNA methylase [Vibrio sp. 665]
MTSANLSQIAAFIWSVADLLRGDFKHSQYGRVILPFTLLRRLECVLEESKSAVLVEAAKVKSMNLPEEAQEKMLLRATNGLSFFNTSSMSLVDTLEGDLKVNLNKYIQSFSKDTQEIFEHFKFYEFVNSLEEANLLFVVVKKFATLDLSVDTLSNYEMGTVFSELNRRFAESSSESFGEHYTPRDIVRLTTSLVLMEDGDVLIKDGVIRSIYDPTAGTGGFLSSGMEYVYELNPKAVMRAFGQELNPESYAICKADMLIKGQDVSRIKLGNTLSQDKLPTDTFDYVLSNPPFGLSWSNVDRLIKNEYEEQGFNGRFGAGLPRVSDATLLFVLHTISKLKDKSEGGSRAGIIVNSTCLFSGDAGSGESEIRRYIIEADLLEAIISLPKNMFYNTSVQPYILILNSNKKLKRKNVVQLIDGGDLGLSLKKSVGMKNVHLDDNSISELVSKYYNFEDRDGCKIVHNNDFKYRQVKVGLNSRKFEYERVPFNVDTNAYLVEMLNDIHEGYEVDRSYIDDKDGALGKVGVEFSFDLLNEVNENAVKQFRYYFKENDERWDIAISKKWNKVIFKEESELSPVDKAKHYLFSLNVDFDLDYLKYFFNSEKWKRWLMTYSSSGVLNTPNKYNTLRKYINFPKLKEQQEIALLLDETAKWKQRLSTLEADLWMEDKSDYSLERYRLPVDKDLHSRMIELAPYPFANIMHHYGSISEFDYKARYEILLKLFECLSIFSVSVALGFVEKESGLDHVSKILRSQKNFLKNATFGNWVKFLEEIIKESSNLNNKALLVDAIFNDKLLELFYQSVTIRNDTSGHGSYPTKSAARGIFKKVDKLYLDFLNIFHEVFGSYYLVRPISGIWNEKEYTYEFEEYSGLGCYPFGLKKVSSKTPFVDDELYFVSSQNSEDKVKLFPFVRLIDLEEDSGLEAFYFYSKKLPDSDDEFIFISHQQIHKQKQLHKNNRLEAIYS